LQKSNNLAGDVSYQILESKACLQDERLSSFVNALNVVSKEN
jgi:hypothetical protein